jgi:hypothetical protein
MLRLGCASLLRALLPPVCREDDESDVEYARKLSWLQLPLNQLVGGGILDGTDVNVLDDTQDLRECGGGEGWGGGGRRECECVCARVWHTQDPLHRPPRLLLQA